MRVLNKVLVILLLELPDFTGSHIPSFCKHKDDGAGRLMLVRAFSGSLSVRDVSFLRYTIDIPIYLIQTVTGVPMRQFFKSDPGTTDLVALHHISKIIPLSSPTVEVRTTKSFPIASPRYGGYPTHTQLFFSQNRQQAYLFDVPYLIQVQEKASREGLEQSAEWSLLFVEKCPHRLSSQ